MSVKLRLTRRGAKKRPFYWIVAATTDAPRDGRFLEKLGTYNPMLERDADKRIVVSEERVRHWLSVGAVPSDRVARMLHEKGILAEPPPRREQTKKPVPKAKAQERLAAAEEAKQAATQAAEEPKAEPSPEPSPETSAEKTEPPAEQAEEQTSEAAPEAVAEATAEDKIEDKTEEKAEEASPSADSATEEETTEESKE